MLVPELCELADKLDRKSYKRLTKKELIAKIVENQSTEKKVSDTPKTDQQKNDRKDVSDVTSSNEKSQMKSQRKNLKNQIRTQTNKE